MLTLAQLLAAHGSILVLDAASARVQVGWIEREVTPTWETAGEEAGRGLFTASAALFARVGKSLEDVSAFVFCEGPGSMLGTRTVAMTLRTWQLLQSRPIYSFQSLAAAGRAEWQRAPRSLHVIADARRDTWHVQSIRADGSFAALSRIATDSLPVDGLLTPAGFRQWSVLPSPVPTCSYELAEIFPRLGSSELFSICANPDAFQHEAPEYKRWSAQVHSSATADRK